MIVLTCETIYSQPYFRTREVQIWNQNHTTNILGKKSNTHNFEDIHGKHIQY